VRGAPPADTRILRASWIVTMAGPPLRDGWVAVAGERIVAAGSGEPPAGAFAYDLGRAAILPGLVNAHTHLELSYLRDAVPPASAFVSWIGGVMAARRTRPDPASPEILRSVEDGIAASLAAGTALVGDISNTLVTFEPLAASRLAAVVFYELIKFNPDDGAAVVDRACDRIAALRGTAAVRVSLAAHAPYSVAPAILRALAAGLGGGRLDRCSVHVAESVEEVEFVRAGIGPWRDLLERLGSWDPAWAAPGASPVRYLDEMRLLGPRLLAVHGVQVSRDDLRLLAARGATLVTCPRSNRHTGAGDPPLDAFYESGAPVAVGTDSLASSPDLNVFAELAAMRALAPRVPASTLLGSATLVGARALGFGDELGSIEPGKRAALLAVDIPPGVDDVEEYLVSGIQPEQVQWIGATDAAG
jgi:cytosine/adenosine deaminase-related metal-dependent hydrolase